MKTRLTLTLSVLGVLAAGSAAALANAQLLDGATPVTAATEAIVAAQPAAATAATAATATGLAAGDAATGAGGSATGSAPPERPATATYRVGSSGSVVLDSGGDALRITRAEAAPGWELTETEQDGRRRVSATFRSATTEVEFSASLVLGVVDTSVRSFERSSGTGSSDDDHDEDGHDEDEYEDEDHGRDAREQDEDEDEDD